MGALKSFLKIFGVLSLVILIIVSVTGFMVFSDAKEFSQRFPSEPNIFLLVDGGEVLAGAKNLMHAESPDPMTKKQHESYEKHIHEGDYESLVGDNYKVFLVKKRMFESLPEEDMAGNQQLSTGEIIEALNSESAREWMIEKALNESAVPEEYEAAARKKITAGLPHEGELRSSLFLILLSSSSESEGPAMIISEYKKGNIEVYPVTTLFRFIEYMPDSAVEAAESAVSGKKE